MELRRCPRIPFQCSISILGDQIVGQGTISNLSLGGCKIQSNANVYIGTQLGLRVFLPDHGSPMDVTQATVRWLIGREFGVEFTRMEPEAQQRLGLFVHTLL